jgi:RNA polymerase sigma-70 factor (ECF subfamily)
LYGLSAQDREILMLKHSERWTYREIAEYLGISADKVVYRLARARARLRQRLQATGDDWEKT